MNKKILGIRKGFTLAEVFITLGIIGVVAAMTIPTLIQNTNSVKFQAQFKKSVSTLSQAALMAQAQYDMDYSAMSIASDATNCASDSLTTNRTATDPDTSQTTTAYTMCGLFNSTLAGQSYIGTYSNGNTMSDGVVPNANASGPYHITTVGSGFSVSNGDLIFSLADGSFVGFRPAARKCGVLAGTVLSSTLIGDGGDLENCVGFIDVNGANPPNEEVSCAGSSSTAIGTNATACALSAVGTKSADVYPIIFHNGTVEPATNAARAALTRAK